MQQHLVSRVVLRRWANHRNGPVARLDLTTVAEDMNKVEELARVADLVVVGADETERRWQEVERRLPYAFAQLDAGCLLTNDRAVATIREAIALHHARSNALAAVLQRLQSESGDRIGDRLLEQFGASRALHALTGLLVPSRIAESRLREKILDLFHGHLQLQGFPGEQFLENFDIARNKVDEYELELWTAVEHEFLISDAPVVVYDKDADAVGILNGVPWGNADVIFMPLGPRHLVALSKERRENVATARVVVWANSLQVRGAYREVFFRPASGLGEAIATALRQSKSA